MTRTKALLVVIALLALSAGFTDAEVFRFGNHLASHVQVQCATQRKQLPADHALAAVLSNLHSLLIVPETKIQREQVATETPLQRYLTHELDKHLAAYQKAENGLPHTQRC